MRGCVYCIGAGRFVMTVIGFLETRRLKRFALRRRIKQTRVLIPAIRKANPRVLIIAMPVTFNEYVISVGASGGPEGLSIV
jgi:hypothetical protein